MTDLYHPSRGGKLLPETSHDRDRALRLTASFAGTRGGAAEFKWDNVKGDKDRSVGIASVSLIIGLIISVWLRRENYLGMPDCFKC